MSENNIDKQKLLNAILNAKDLKINKNAVERAKSGDISAIAKGLDESKRKKLNEVLADKDKTRELLASKQAREIMKKFLGGKNNG